jgi:hypothetical protein
VIVNVACVMFSVWPPLVSGTRSAFAVELMPLVKAICAGARFVDVESEHAATSPNTASDPTTTVRPPIVERLALLGEM